tara:strand:- start:2305 stop:2775 length:471 start_codon:yes stop_codon:yes gene_type:complete
MNLKVYRFSSQKDSTNGLLMESVKSGLDFLCYTLEDEYRDAKIFGETRIDAGIYTMSLRTEGGFHNRYSSRFSDFHKGMLQIDNVPNFEYVLVHCGNSTDDTAACLLVGDTQTNNSVDVNGFIGKSTQAYKRIYPIIAEAILSDKLVTIEYIDINK